MLRAIDKNKDFVLIDDADENETYFCPICNQPLIQKRGEIREHHFAHIGDRGSYSRGYVPCSDTWHYDKTDWHIQWQKRFPDECYERIVTRGNEKHIADVLLNDIVIEFQHSSISVDDFRERNSFYTSCGYKVIWVFDFIEEYEEERIYRDYPDNKYRWNYVKKLFREIDLKYEQATVFFQFSDEEEGSAGVLERVTNSYMGFKVFYTDEHTYTIEEFVNQAKKNSLAFYRESSIRQVTLEEVSTEGVKTIEALWSTDYQWMIVENVINGKRMLIRGNKGEMLRERGREWDEDDGRIIGKYTNIKPNGQGYTYSDKLYVVWDAEKPIWKLITSKERSDSAYNYRNVDDTDSKYSECSALGRIVNQTNAMQMLVKCLFNDITYMLVFVDAPNSSRRFNAYTIDIETGETGDNNNDVVSALFHKKVWIELKKIPDDLKSGE